MNKYNINVLQDVKDTNMDDVRDITSVFERINSDLLEKKISAIRNTENTEKARQLKLSLPAFTVSGTFNERRIKERIKEYNGIIHLDYDHVENPEALKEQVSRLETTFCAFISPSGKGLKVFVKTNANLEFHEKAFNSIKSDYDFSVGVESDKAVKDVTRLCFVSYDSQLYLNNDSIVYNVVECIETKEIINLYTPKQAYNYTSNIVKFTSGSRNRFTYIYACNANKFGVELSDTTAYIAHLAAPDFTYNEIERTIEYAYKRNVGEFAILQYCNIATFNYDHLQSTSISDNIYNDLPQTLKEACDHFEGREKDVFLIASITVLSGYFSNIMGAHDKKRIYPNLYAFIVANAASGKSAAKYAKIFGKDYHLELKKSSQESMKQYRKIKAEYDKRKKSNKAENVEEPEKPNQLMFFIPGDTSEASLVGHIGENEGKGCLFETEVDTISGANKQEWGNFSHVLRKNFHHEDISRTSKTDDEFTEIENSRFSFLTTGTPDQVKRLIPNKEDGLYSRFIFYVFTIPYKWRSTFTQEIDDSMDVILSKLGTSFYSDHKNNEERKFSLTPEQGKKLDNTFDEICEKMKKDKCEKEAIGVLYRHGLMTYKIAMTLSAIESKEVKIICSDKIFEISIKLITDVFLDNSLKQLKRMPKSSRPYKSNIDVFLEALPEVFDRKTAISISKKIGIAERSADGYLKKLVEQKLIRKQNHGFYCK